MKSYSTRVSFLTDEEREEFFKEEKRASVYREYLYKILLNDIRVAAINEEAMSDKDEISNSIATRRALRALINNLMIGR